MKKTILFLLSLAAFSHLSSGTLKKPVKPDPVSGDYCSLWCGQNRKALISFRANTQYHQWCSLVATSSCRGTTNRYGDEDLLVTACGMEQACDLGGGGIFGSNRSATPNVQEAEAASENDGAG